MVLLGYGDGVFPQAVSTNHRCIWYWPQFATDVLIGGCEPPVCGRGGRRGLENEMGPQTGDERPDVLRAKNIRAQCYFRLALCNNFWLLCV